MGKSRMWSRPGAKLYLRELVVVCGLLVALAACSQGSPTVAGSPASLTPTPTSTPVPTETPTPAPTQTPTPTLTATPTPALTPTPILSSVDAPGPTASALPELRRSVGDRRGSGFVPLDNPAFISPDEASFLGDEELVLGYESEGEARAYPIRMMRFHHIVNDTVKGVPVLITY